MRHRVGHRKLGRVTEHRLALLRNQAQALLRHERIETTVPKAKELRPFVERLITIAKRGLHGLDDEGNGRSLHARRLVLRDIPDKAVVGKLFDAIAPRFAARPGGYTRLLRVGYRRGDSAEIAQVELVGSEYSAKHDAPQGATSATTEEAAQKSDGVGGRIRAAAQRIRGKKAEAGDAESPGEPVTKKRAAAAKGAAKKRSDRSAGKSGGGKKGSAKRSKKSDS